MKNDGKIDRKTFLTWTLAAAGGAALGCTTSESGPTGAAGTGGGAGTGAAGTGAAGTGAAGTGAAGTGAAGTGAAGTGAAGTSGTAGTTGTAGTGSVGANCGTNLKVTITSNHMHVLTITAADLSAGATKAYHTMGQSTHDHVIQLTAADFASLKAGKEVRKPSCNDGHEHEFIINCLGTEGTGMPNVAALCGDAAHPANRDCGESAAHVCPDPPYPA